MNINVKEKWFLIYFCEHCMWPASNKISKTIPKFPTLPKNSKNIRSRQELFIHIKQKDTMTIVLILKRNIMRNNLSWFRDRGTTAAEWEERNKQLWADFFVWRTTHSNGRLVMENEGLTGNVLFNRSLSICLWWNKLWQ